MTGAGKGDGVAGSTAGGLFDEITGANPDTTPVALHTCCAVTYTTVAGGILPISTLVAPGKAICPNGQLVRSGITPFESTPQS